MTVNFVQQNITCFINTHVKKILSTPAGCKNSCPTVSGLGGLNIDRVNYSSPKPIVQFGCENSNKNNVSQVQERFAELIYEITASGVMFEQGYCLTILVALIVAGLYLYGQSAIKDA
ncbi:hypothetical protein C2G38_2176742 [Gigaspora rosea]|uniref:Uncharacterized protein n=1 Tax=Gigaspora rosea TaxID=44941 RepID=A0A397VG16_9GLOM|nr:hypothetical protein C2G38_2176742 [Gigaspora rosea]